MSFKGKLSKGRYALLTAAVLACIGAPHGYAAEDVSGVQRRWCTVGCTVRLRLLQPHADLGNHWHFNDAALSSACMVRHLSDGNDDTGDLPCKSAEGNGHGSHWRAKHLSE